MKHMNDILLNLFTGSDQGRPALMFPNNSNGVVYATDSYSIISIPENDLELKYSSNSDYPNAQKLFDEFFNKETQSIKVNVSDISKELVKARIEVDKRSIACKECDGTGVVEFEYEDRYGESHYKDCDCPECCGSGHNEINHPFARVKLGDMDGENIGIYIDKLYFHPFQLYKIFMAAVLNHIDEFDILHNQNRYGSVVIRFANISILTMLMVRN